MTHPHFIHDLEVVLIFMPRPLQQVTALQDSVSNLLSNRAYIYDPRKLKTTPVLADFSVINGRICRETAKNNLQSSSM